MAFRNPFAQQLSRPQVALNMTAAPERDPFIQQLLARTLQNNGRGSRSKAESLDIAASPIVAALLGRIQGAQQQQQQSQQRALANQLVGGAMRTNIPLENLPNDQGQPQAPDVTSVPTEGPTGANRSALAGILAQNPQAMAAMAMQQAMPPQQKPALTPYEAATLGLQTQRLKDEESKPPAISWHDAGDRLVAKLPNGQDAPGVASIPKADKDAALFEGPVGEIMGALAEKGFQLPVGLRSKEQQAATFKAILSRHPDQSVDDVAEGIINGKIGLQTEMQAQKEFSSTRPNTAGGNLIAINTAVNHIDSTLPLVDALRSGDVTAINKARNAFNKSVGGSTAPTDYNSLKEFIQGEIAKSVIPGGGGEQERAALGAALDAANSPQAIKSSLQKIQIALAGKTEALKQRWDETTQGKRGSFDQFLQPATIHALGMGHALDQVQQQQPGGFSGPTQQQSQPQSGGWSITPVQ